MIVRLIKFIISLVFWIFSFLYRRFQQIFNKEVKPIAVILYYHSIMPEQRKKFIKQLDEIIRTAKPISVDLKGHLRNNTHYVGITFDDGFQNLIENALPELNKRKIPSTIFVPTGYLGKLQDWEIDNGFNAEFQSIMTADQLRQVSSNLVTIGSHTITHAKLASLPEAEAKTELVDSKIQLERILNKKISLLSFPYGNYNRRILELAKNAGYNRVFSIDPCLAFSQPAEFLTGRVSVSLSDWTLEFRLKVLGAYRWLSLVFIIKRKIKRGWDSFLSKLSFRRLNSYHAERNTGVIS